MREFVSILMIFGLFSFCSIQDNEEVTITSRKSIDSTLTFRSIFAVDEQTAYVSGNQGALYRTTNGGEIWMKLEIHEAPNADFRDIHVLPDKSILLMSVGMGADSKIFKSTDHGETWEIKFVNSYAEGFLNSIAFWNDKDGIAVGDPINGKPFVIITKDGGETWNEIDKINIPESLHGEACFAASGTCVAVYGDCYGWMGTGGPDARIFKTTDMGKTWSVHSTPIISGENTTGIYSVFFKDEMNGFILGGDYTKESGTERTFASTQNGGESWQLIEPGAIYFQSCLAKLAKKEKEYFVSTGPAASYYSTDGKEFVKFSDTGFHCLSADKENKVIWGAGSKGRTARIDL